MSAQLDMLETDLFDLKLGSALRDEGSERAATVRADLLALGRKFCRDAALRRPDRTATADDASRGFLTHNLPADSLGNGAGALFRGKDWEFTGQWKASARVSNHGHQNRVWRLVA